MLSFAFAAELTASCWLLRVVQHRSSDMLSTNVYTSPSCRHHLRRIRGEHKPPSAMLGHIIFQLPSGRSVQVFCRVVQRGWPRSPFRTAHPVVGRSHGAGRGVKFWNREQIAIPKFASARLNGESLQMPGMYIAARSDPAPGIEVFILASTLEVRGFTGPLCALLPFQSPT